MAQQQRGMHLCLSLGLAVRTTSLVHELVRNILSPMEVHGGTEFATEFSRI
jgi:hypothetical protein